MVATIQTPSTLLVGGGAVREVGGLVARAHWCRPLIVADPGIRKLGLADSLMQGLEAAGYRATPVFADIVPDPTTTSVSVLTDAIRSGAHDCLIAIGGGSSIDTAKAAGVLAARGGRCRDYKVPRVVDGGAIPLIAVPTTAGTGSEVTRFTVITDVDTGEKMLLSGPAFLPHTAVVDYELTLTAPLRLTADTAIDSLTHAIEAYVSRRANPYSDGLATLAMRAIWANIRRVCADLSDRPGREALMLAATQAGLAFSNASVALVHGMSRPIGAFFHVPHGLSNAMLLPAVTAFSVPAAQRRYADCARIVGLAAETDADGDACRKLVDGLAQLNADLGVPTPKAYGIDEGRYFALIPTMAEQALASGSPANNPRVPSQAEIESLYRQVWN